MLSINGYASILVLVVDLYAPVTLKSQKKDIGWANSGQVLMINSVSVREFQKRLSEEMCMYPNDSIVLERRFRPNIVVE